MDLWFAGVLGIVQGLTEFLPISSTAHLRIVPELFGVADPGAAFSAVIQLGTVVAVIAYFARDLFIDIPRQFFSDRQSPQGRLPGYLVLGTIPVVVLGLGLKGFIEGGARSLYVVAAALAVVGGVMIVADRRGSLSRTLDSLRLSDAMIIGLAQAGALIPGVSRSGATIIAALFLGFSRPDAARFSFLLGIPAIAGAGLYELPDALAHVGEGAWPAIAVGTLAALVSGYASIAWLLKFLGTRTLSPFGYYRVALGVALATMLAAGILTPL